MGNDLGIGSIAVLFAPDTKLVVGRVDVLLIIIDLEVLDALAEGGINVSTGGGHDRRASGRVVAVAAIAVGLLVDDRAADIGLSSHTLLGALLVLLRRVLDNVRRELVAHVNASVGTARLAIAVNILVVVAASDDQLRLGVLARGTENKLLDERVEQLAEAIGLVGAIDNVALAGHGGLGAKLDTKELGGVCGQGKSGKNTYKAQGG